VAVSDKEWKKWREKAKQKDISVSRYVRECVKAADQRVAEGKGP
jgi:hypothetical protein